MTEKPTDCTFVDVTDNEWYKNSPPRERRVTFPTRRKLTAEQVRQIRLAIKNGWSLYAIGKRFGVAPASIRAIHRNKSYRDVE